MSLNEIPITVVISSGNGIIQGTSCDLERPKDMCWVRLKQLVA